MSFWWFSVPGRGGRSKTCRILILFSLKCKTKHPMPIPLQGNKGLIKELWTTPCFLNKALFIGGVVALVWGLPLDSHQLPRPEAFRPVLQLWVRCYREMRCSEVVRCLSFFWIYTNKDSFGVMKISWESKVEKFPYLSKKERRQTIS